MCSRICNFAFGNPRVKGLKPSFSTFHAHTLEIIEASPSLRHAQKWPFGHLSVFPVELTPFGRSWLDVDHPQKGFFFGFCRNKAVAIPTSVSPSFCVFFAWGNHWTMNSHQATLEKILSGHQATRIEYSMGLPAVRQDLHLEILKKLWRIVVSYMFKSIIGICPLLAVNTNALGVI